MLSICLCIGYSLFGSSSLSTKGKRRFYICVLVQRKIAVWAAKKPDIIGLFAGDIFFVSTLWWTRRDSNPRPLGCEPNALPAELQARIWINGVEQTRSTPLLYILLQEMQVFYSTFGSLAITAAQRGHSASCSPTAFTLCSTFQQRPHLAP